MGFNSGFKGLKITANHDRSTLHSLSTAVIRIKETSLYKCIERLRNAVLGTENFCNSRCKICAEDVRNSFRFLLLVSWQKTPKVMVRGWQGHLVCKKFKYWKSKFSQNTTNLLSKWRHVSTQWVVIIRPIIETCLRYIKWKCTFGSQNFYNSVRTWVQLKLIFPILYIIKCIHVPYFSLHFIIYNIVNINLNCTHVLTLL